MWCKKRKRKAEGKSVDDSSKQQKLESRDTEQEPQQAPGTSGPSDGQDPPETRTTDSSSGTSATERFSNVPVDNDAVPRPDPARLAGKAEYETELAYSNNFHESRREEPIAQKNFPTEYDRARLNSRTFEYDHSSSRGVETTSRRHEYVEPVCQYEQLSPASDHPSERAYTSERDYKSYGYTTESRESKYTRPRYVDSQDYRYRDSYKYSHGSDGGKYTGGAGRRAPSPSSSSDTYLRW